MGVFILLISGLSLAVPLLSKSVVDLIVAQLGGKAVDVSFLIRLLVAIIAVDILSTVLIALSQWAGDILSVRLQSYLSRKFYEHLLSLDIGFYDNQITGTIVNKMYRGITSITDFLQSMLNNFLPFFLTALVTIILLANYSLIIAILLTVLFPLYIIISHKSTVAWRGFEAQKNEINDISQGRVFESISGIRVVKAFIAEMHELSSFITARKQIESLTVRQTRQWHLYDFVRRLSLNIILFVIFAYIVYWTFHGRYTIGEMTLLLQLVQQARFPLFAMSFILGQIQQASAGSKDFFQLLETKTSVIDGSDAYSLQISAKEKTDPFIAFKSVSFGYEQDQRVLDHVTFEIHGNEKMALVGESGEGKSTLVNLILRYYEPQQGMILINGRDVSKVSQQSLRSNIAVVFQESLLFSGTIFENIRYGKPSATVEEVTEAAKAANAYEFISKLPHQFESVIGERGVKLSGGQKQRIAIARAMLKDAPIIILDEATSSLDSKSEVQVQQGLDRLLKNRTSIIIAHRLSTIAHANHILVLSKGKIAQYGTSRQLLADKKGLYAQMVSLQSKLLKMPSEERETKLREYDLIG